MDEMLMRVDRKLTALVIGGTGLVGKAIVRQLIGDNRVGEVRCFLRRTTGLSSPKLKEYLVDFEHIDQWKDKIVGDVLFSALGTTRSSAGSKDAQWKVDFDYQLDVAKAAKGNGLRSLVLISSVGADSRSSYFYLGMKGKLDEAVSKLGFESVQVLRPGPLTGPRESRRTMEELSAPALRLLSKLPGMSAYRPISGEEVARAAVLFGLEGKDGYHVHEAQTLFGLG